VEAEMIAPNGGTFKARLAVLDGKKLGQFDLDHAAAHAAREAIEKNGFTVRSVETKPVSRNPAPPFTTSTLQQEAARRLGFTASHTMRVAQSLYEEGRITYMRTDGVQIAGEALNAVRDLIARDYGSKADVLPDKPRFYATKAKNAQEAHEAIRPTDFSRRPGRADSDAERLYALIWNRTVASQMASAKLERTTVELFDDEGRHGLKATGQVVTTPGFLALYAEGRDEEPGKADEDDDARLPRLAGGDRCAAKAVAAIQSFTEPPPRYSEATLVKKLEELGIGRPSTYASILQTLRDRAYVRVEKNRFHAEEKGRLVTAFLERFFGRYVEYDFTAGLEAQLDDVSAGDASYLELLRAFWADFQPKTAEIMEQRPSDITAALDAYLAPYLFPDTGDGKDPRLCPKCGAGRLSLKTGRFGAFVGCSNYPACTYTRPFASENGAQANDGPVELGRDRVTGEMITLRSGRFGRFVQRGEGDKPQRASIPKDVSITGPEDLDWAVKLLNLPRTIGLHPETGEPITASIGRYGPYLAHNGSYARLSSTMEVFETGMNAAVVKLAEAAAAKANGGRPVRAAARALAELGSHPESGAAVRVLSGRYGPYITDGTTNANVPKGTEPTAVTLDEAVALLAARAAAAPAKKGRKAPARKAAAKKPAARTKAT
jgi:DNA topoisomerase-1